MKVGRTGSCSVFLSCTFDGTGVCSSVFANTICIEHMELPLLHGMFILFYCTLKLFKKRIKGCFFKKNQILPFREG